MVQHRFLGDVDKHEPFGIEDAVEGQVFVADGNGGGAWEDVNSSLPGLVLQHRLTYGTIPSASLTANTWQVRLIDHTVRNVITGASLSSNQITLPAGTYYAEWWGQFYDTFDVQTRLYNTTAGALVDIGSVAAHSDNDDNFLSYQYMARSEGVASFTLSTTSVLELQAYAEVGDSNGFGFQFSHQTGESYEDIKAQIKFYRDIAS